MLSIGIIVGVGKPDDRFANPLNGMTAERKVQTAKRGGIAATRYPAKLDFLKMAGLVSRLRKLSGTISELTE